MIQDLRNRIYYRLKPLIPRRLRVAMRRWIVQLKRQRVGDVWPIAPGSERPPEGWPGWPDGKKFAFVVTHDVEGPEGLNKSLSLMQLDKELGFRSSFNFVPEGSYHVPAANRNELTRNGFEVGVHDLRHDGRLYQSPDVFRRNAARINHFLKEWNAVGFRSGFMLNRLDWLHQLNIQYDASTFDTDPFEPQPQGSRTIFPFRVNGENGASYVELPYTLPQDSTMFLFLEEKGIDLWKKKLEWIVTHGGMALLNVHPDYLAFDPQEASADTFPVALYREFLEFVEREYHGQYWNALPREIAEFTNAKRLGAPVREKAGSERIA